MKKLLSILTISTLTASVPASLLANTPLTRAKRDVSTLTSNANNDYLPLKEIKNISGDVYKITIDTNDNIYFSVFANGTFVSKHWETTPEKIDDINNVVNSLAVDSENNIYFGTNNGAFVLKHGETTPEKIDDINNVVNSLAVDSENNIYFGTNNGAYKLVAGSDTATKLDGISENITSLAVDSFNNIYFGLYNIGAFILQKEKNTALKINGIAGQAISIAVDKNDNIYFGTNNGAYKLVAGSDTATKLDGIIGYVRSIAIDKNYNIYFGTDNSAFVLKHGETTATKINGINSYINSIAVDKNDNIYFGTDKGAYFTPTTLNWIKQQSQFALVDSTKTQTWTRPDLLSVDGEVNIDIANPNIDKVVFDNVQQPQTSKHWTINVKPETAARDHNLQVMFTLDGKQYTSEITVSMQAKIDPITPPVQQNLSDLIKTIDLGNIVDNNDDTIFSAVNQKNSNVIDDFSQITIEKKDDHSATLTAKKDSKSYAGAVDVTYNVMPATTVDLKIDVTSTSSNATVIKDYLGQIDKSNITNPVNIFYYANSESVITMIKPTASSVITGVVYGCDEQWNKTSQSKSIDPTSGLEIDKGQYGSVDGRYLIELQHKDLPTNKKTIYLQVSEKQKVEHYWDTPNGKQFEQWAQDQEQGYDNIRGSSAGQLNNLFAVSKTWKQSLKHLDLKLDNFVVDNIKNVSQDEINTYKTKLLVSVKSQVEKYALNVVENTDYVISADNLVAGDWTSGKDVKVQAVNDSTKLLSFAIKTIPVQQKEQPTPLTPTPDNNTPDNNKKDGDSKLWIIGVVVGVLAGLGLAYLLFKRFVFDKYIYPKIIARRHNKLVEQIRKEEAEKEAAKQKGGEE